MTFAGFTEQAFDFYEGLRADNSKAYWTAHKDVYESAVRGPMRELLESLASTFDGEPMLFRPYRDVRFSKDKSPYKTQQGGFLQVAPGLGYWMQLDADGVMVGGGFHAHDRTQTQRFRSAINEETTGQQLVTLTNKLIKAGYALGGDQIKTRPRGVAAGHPRLDLMRYEFLTVSRPIPHSESTSKTFAKTVAGHWKKVTPLVQWCQAYAAPTP